MFSSLRALRGRIKNNIFDPSRQQAALEQEVQNQIQQQQRAERQRQQQHQQQQQINIQQRQYVAAIQSIYDVMGRTLCSFER